MRTPASQSSSDRPAALRVIHFATTSVMHKSFNLPLARYQRERGLIVEFGCGEDIPRGYESAVGELARDGFAVHVVPFPYAIRPAADARALLRLWRFFRRHRYDVVHTHTSKDGVLVRLAARAAGCAVVHTAHDLYFRNFPPGVRRSAYAWIERGLGRVTDTVLFTNPEILEAANAEGIRGRRANTVVGAPLRELTWFAASETEAEAFRQELRLTRGPIVACVGRLVAFKGIDTLLRAAVQVLARRPDAQFVVLGGGPLEAELRALAERLGIAPRVTFTGFRADDRDVLRLLRLADVFCLPTRREGLGIAFVEAMAMGVAVVGPRIAPITTVVAEGETGLLVEAEDDAAYAAAIVSLLEDPERRRAMGDAGRRRVAAHFDPRRVFEAVTASYPEPAGHRR